MPNSPNPCFRPLSIFLVALSLSIGWGIRGNYGHETGAMFPGALAAMAVCLLSGREDWRQRVGYFGFFGALGWGFGGSISYMMVIGYTHSGQALTQLYGFGGLFLIGFLWAALGGAGTAIPAVLDRKSLTDMFKPIALLLCLWSLRYFYLHPLDAWVQTQLELQGMADASERHFSALYWLDSDWLSVLMVVCGLLLFDLVDRQFARAYWLPLFAVVGAMIGFGLHLLFGQLGWTEPIGRYLLGYQGDVSRYEPENMVVNWPLIIVHFHEYIGALVGLMIGVTVYFVRFGEFRCGSGLFMHMALGWFAFFIALPVLGSQFLADTSQPVLAPDYGGIRLTSPRGDNWAGVLGTVVGAIVYFLRNNQKPLALVTMVCGTIGGIAFAGIAWLRLMLVSFGNTHLSDNPAIQEKWAHWQETPWTEPSRMPFPEFISEIVTDPAWAHYQRQNWHSFLEQSYGFVNGIGVVVALGILATRVPRLNDDGPRQRWTHVLALTFVLPVLTYLNMAKNVRPWKRSENAGNFGLPDAMKAPWIENIEFSADGWFSLFFAAAGLALVLLMIVHLKRPLSIVPATWLGRGQLIYILLLWAFVIGNFGRALPDFRAGRLLTEGIIQMNAVLATVLILVLPREQDTLATRADVNYTTWLWGSLLALILAIATLPYGAMLSVREVYGDAHAGHGGINYRFGPNANWKREPILKNQEHR